MFSYFCGFRGGSANYFTKSMEENGTKIKVDKYLSNFFSDKAIEFIEKDKEKPFFLFLSFNAPHAPMQATPEDLALSPNIENKRRKTLAAMIWSMDSEVAS